MTQPNADQQSSKQPTAIGLGEQFKMDVLCLIGIGYGTVGTAHNGHASALAAIPVRTAVFHFPRQASRASIDSRLIFS